LGKLINILLLKLGLFFEIRKCRVRKL